MNTAREKERKSERGRREEESKVGKKKREDLGVQRCMHSRRNQVPRSVLHRAHRHGRGGGGDVGGSGRIDRVWAATNPRFSLSLPLSPFRRFVLPLFTSHPRARHIPLFSFIRLSSFRFAFFVPPAPFLPLVLTARSSFLPASPFHRSHALSPPSFLFLPSLIVTSFSSSFSFISRYPPVSNQISQLLITMS